MRIDTHVKFDEVFKTALWGINKNVLVHTHPINKPANQIASLLKHPIKGLVIT